MKHTRRLALLTLSTTPVFAAPFLAIGDNAELFLTANAQTRFEDNVSLASDALKQDDVIFEFTPGFELLYGKRSAVRSSLSVYEQFIRYADLNGLDSELFNAIFTSEYTGTKLTANAEASYRQLNQNTRAVAGAVLVRRDTYAAKLNAEYAFTEKTKGGTGIQYEKTDYELAGFTDSQSFSVPLNYYYAISPKVDLSAGFRYRQTDVDAINADTEDLNFNVGARGEFTPKLSGSFDIGYTLRKPDVGSDEGLVAANAGLTYAYSLKTQFTLGLRRDFDTSATGQSQESSSITLGASTRFNESFAANASLQYQDIDYPAARSDQYVSASVGVTYTYNQLLSFGAAYTHQNNSSNAAFSEFTANVVSLSANFRY